MVKGRRVRAVVACARNDECCSPNPKRRGQKLTLNRVLQQNKTNTITAFFQNVDIEETKPISDELEIKPLIKEEDEILSFFHQNDSKKKVVDDVIPKIPTTPVMIKKQADKQSTPHRIELCSDGGVLTTKAEPVSILPQQPKSKKRLNLNNNNHIDQTSDMTHKDNNHKLTDYFPVRRSVRKTKKIVLEEKQRSLEQLVRSGSEDGLQVKVFDDKGRGVVASKPFLKGDFVVEYSGDLIDLNEAKRREDKYAQDKNAGCYMYYFKHNNLQYCVDATSESGKLGRLVNHSRNGNLITRTISVDNKPRLVLIAKDNIKEGNELTYDYGDRSKESLRHHPWLAY